MIRNQRKQYLVCFLLCETAKFNENCKLLHRSLATVWNLEMANSRAKGFFCCNGYINIIYYAVRLLLGHPAANGKEWGLSECSDQIQHNKTV